MRRQNVPSNDIEMTGDDHVPNNTECMDLAEDIEAAQGGTMANVLSSEAGHVISSSIIKVALHHFAAAVSIYSYHPSLTRPSLNPILDEEVEGKFAPQLFFFFNIAQTPLGLGS